MGFLKGMRKIDLKGKGGVYCFEKLVVYFVVRYKYIWVLVIVNYRIEVILVFKI